MEGELKVCSEYGKGSSFYFDARFGLASGKKVPDSDVTHDLVGRGVLILDESQTNRLIFTEMCEYWGMRTYDCADRAEAFDVLSDAAQAQKPFDLLIVDRFTPGGGFEFAIDARTLYPSLPVILTTSDEVPGEATRCKELGLVGYAAKPVRRSELLRLICQSLAASETRESAPAAPRPLAACRLLIAEDSEDNRFLLQAYLKNTPYEIAFAENGERAVTACQSAEFDLVLMDMQMPVMDGLSATRAIRLHEQSSGRLPVPILALTANARREDVDACKAAGCTSHLSKPIAKAKLLSAIEQHLLRTPEPPQVTAIVVDIPEGLEDAARRYIRSRQKEALEMKQLLLEQNFERLRLLAHNMKGTGLPYGFPLVTELGGEIEVAAKQQNAAALAEQLMRLAEYVNKVAHLVELARP